MKAAAGGARMGEHLDDLGFIEGRFLDPVAAIQAGAGLEEHAGATAGALVAAEFGGEAGAVAEQRHGFAGEGGNNQFAIAHLGQKLVFVDVE